MYTANSIRNIVLLGHSGSGKTALAESLLYMTGVIDRIGKNADGNTVCDFDPEEITARFVRGDASRTAEGNGLGLAIAKSYTEICGGSFRVETDGDMFKAILSFEKAQKPAAE